MRVAMFHQQEVSRLVETPSFTFCPRGRFPRLQTLVWNWLMKKKALAAYSQRVTDYERVVLDTASAVDRILEAHEELARLHRHARVLLIGSEDFADVMGEEGIRRIGGFSFAATWPYHRELFGLQVRVVPWMSGVLVLDDDFMDLGRASR